MRIAESQTVHTVTIALDGDEKHVLTGQRRRFYRPERVVFEWTTESYRPRTPRTPLRLTKAFLDGPEVGNDVMRDSWTWFESDGQAFPPEGTPKIVVAAYELVLGHKLVPA